MPPYKPSRAQKKVQDQAPKSSTTNQVEQSAIKKGDEEGKEQGWDGHFMLSLPPGPNSNGSVCILWFQMLIEEVHDGIVAGNAVLIFKDIMTFVLKDQ